MRKSQVRQDIEQALKSSGIKLNAHLVFNDKWTASRRIKFCGVKATPKQMKKAEQLLSATYDNVKVFTNYRGDEPWGRCFQGLCVRVAH